MFKEIQLLLFRFKKGEYFVFSNLLWKQYSIISDSSFFDQISEPANSLSNNTQSKKILEESGK